MSVQRWRIYYDSGMVWDWRSGPIENAPCDGVIVIVQEDAVVGRELLHMKDFYYWDGKWFGSDRYGLEDYLRRPGWRKIVAGRNTEHANYSSLMERARLDTEFSPKSARHQGEQAAHE